MSIKPINELDLVSPVAIETISDAIDKYADTHHLRIRVEPLTVGKKKTGLCVVYLECDDPNGDPDDPFDVQIECITTGHGSEKPLSNIYWGVLETLLYVKKKFTVYDGGDLETEDE